MPTSVKMLIEIIAVGVVAIIVYMLLRWMIVGAWAHEAPSGSSAFRSTINTLLVMGRPAAVGRLVAPVVVDPVEGFANRAFAHILPEASKAGLSVLAKAPTIANRNTASTVILELTDIAIVAAADHRFPNTMQQRSAAAMGSFSGPGHFLVIATARSGRTGDEVHSENNRGVAASAMAVPSDNFTSRRKHGVTGTESFEATKLSSGQVGWSTLGGRFTHIIPIHTAPSGFVYPQECCGGADCRPIVCSTVQDRPDGSVNWLGLLFPREQVKVSRDASCHVCVTYDSAAGAHRVPHCIFLSPTM